MPREVLPSTLVPWNRVRALETQARVLPYYEILEVHGLGRSYADGMDSAHLSTTGNIALCPRCCQYDTDIKGFGAHLITMARLSGSLTVDPDHTRLPTASMGWLFTSNGTYDLQATLHYRNDIFKADSALFNVGGSLWSVDRRRVCFTVVHVISHARLYSPTTSFFDQRLDGTPVLITAGPALALDVNTASSGVNMHPYTDCYVHGSGDVVAAGDVPPTRIPNTSAVSNDNIFSMAETVSFPISVSLHTYAERPDPNGYYHALLIVPYVYAYNIAATYGASSYPSIQSTSALSMVASGDSLDLCTAISYLPDDTGNTVDGAPVYGLPTLS